MDRGRVLKLIFSGFPSILFAIFGLFETMNSPEFKNALKATSYQDFEDHKRLFFIYSEILACKHGEGRILDIGCGMGNISRAMGALDFKVLGLDVDPGTIAAAQANNPFPDKIEFSLADADNLEEQTEQFEGIICSEVLEHLKEPGALVQQFSPWLKPGGTLIVTVPNGYGPRELLVTKPVQLILKTPLKYLIVGLKKLLGYKNATLQSNNPDLSHIQFFTFREIKRIMESNGFELKRRGKSNFMEKVFPLSMIFKHRPHRQKWDADFAEKLPHWMNSGFYTSWTKSR